MTYLTFLAAIVFEVIIITVVNVVLVLFFLLLLLPHLLLAFDNAIQFSYCSKTKVFFSVLEVGINLSINLN